MNRNAVQNIRTFGKAGPTGGAGWRTRMQRSAAACGVALIGVTLGAASISTAGAAPVVSQARAQAVNLGLLGGTQTIALSNPATSATSDGTQSSVVQNAPAVSALGGESWLTAGALSELAAAYANGLSSACSGLVAQGATVQVGNGGSCFSSGGSGSGLALDLNAVPSAGSELNGTGSVSIHLNSLIAFADASPSGAIGSVAIAGGTVEVALGGGTSDITIPLNISTAPNQNLLSDVVAAIAGQNNAQLQPLVDTLSNSVAPVLQLTTNVQSMSSGTLTVTALHIGVLGNTAASANLATVVVGPNSGSSMPGAPTGPPVISGITPTSGPASGGTFVTITGSNLGGATAVDFGSTPAKFIVNPDGSLTALSPGGTGTVPVIASNALGTSPATAGDLFTYVSGLSGSAGAPEGSSTSSVASTSTASSVCPSGTSAHATYSYTLPLTIQLGDANLRPKTHVTARIVEGNRIVASIGAAMSAQHTVRVTTKSSVDGLLTGEIVFNRRVVQKAPVPFSSSSMCTATAALTHTETFVTRLASVKVGTRLAGSVYSGTTKLQNFNVQVRGNHTATFVDHTVATSGKVTAKLFKPGTKGKVVLATIRGVTS